MKITIIIVSLFSVLLCGCSQEYDDSDAFGRIVGTVSDYHTNIPIVGASITLSPSGLTIQSDANGQYEFERLDVQQYTLTIQKSGYQSNRKTIMVYRGESQQVNIQLTIIPRE